MYIHSVVVKSFRHLENEEIGPFRALGKSSDLIAFAGPNGSGKSSVLELIGYALSSSYSLSWSLARTFKGFSFEIGIGLTADERSVVSQRLKGDLAEPERILNEQLAAVQARADLSDDQKKAHCAQMSEAHQRVHKYTYQVIEYLATKNVYYRAYEHAAGEYGKDPTLHNQLHSFVTRELKDVLGRSLGFFLRADRTYPQRSFDKRRIFEFENVKKKEHLWTLAFNTSEIQYQDMYEFLVQQRYHYLRELGRYHDARSKDTEAGQQPADPLIPYELLLNKLFPEYKFADRDEQVPTDLFVQIPSGEIITFNDLSSGEKEVFFILAFFIRHNVENAIIVIDEPELHLHPELSRLLVQNIKSIKAGNQIWVATHNAEIIDEAGRDKVLYLARDPLTRKSKLVLATEEEEALAQLRNLFGFSGYIGVAKNLVFLEGDNASQDRKLFAGVFSKGASTVKLVPATGSGSLNRLNAAILSVMEANIGWMKFFLIRDRDYLTDEMVAKYRAHSSGRIYVLSKHELENYLLDFELLHEVLSQIFNIKKTPIELKSIFFDAALKLSSSVIRDMVAFRLNLLVKPQDFSVGKLLGTESFFDAETLAPRSHHRDLLRAKFIESAERVDIELKTFLSKVAVEDIITAAEAEVKAAIDSDKWLDLFPGKELLEFGAKQLGIKNPIPLQNSLIKELSTATERIPEELTAIATAIAKE
jgi:ABC-type lipoprotein export system ATPase subunit